MADRLALYNGALRELGERQLASLSENRAPRRYLDVAWNNQGVDKLLSAGQWRFAQRTVEMVADADLAPAFGYTYAFRKPTDHVRSTKVGCDEFFNAPLEGYEFEKGIFYALISPFYLSYVSNDASYGGDLSIWPANFVTYAELWLARQIVTSLTGNKTDRDELDKAVARALTKAEATDAMEQPTKYPPSGSWVQARTRGRLGRGWADRGRQNQLIG